MKKKIKMTMNEKIEFLEGQLGRQVSGGSLIKCNLLNGKGYGSFAHQLL